MKRASQSEIELGKMLEQMRQRRESVFHRKAELSIEMDTITSTIEAITIRIDALRQAQQTSSDRQKPKHS